MRAADLRERIAVQALSEALSTAGYARSPRYIRAILNGEKRSRPALREISAAIDAIRQLETARWPEWL